MPTKRLTERQAWLRLAAMWRGAKVKRGSPCIGINPPYVAYGLCQSIGDLRETGRIVADVHEKMKAIILAEPCDPLTEYCWPLNLAGARQRVAFCLAQARRLAPKRKKVKA